METADLVDRGRGDILSVDRPSPTWFEEAARIEEERILGLADQVLGARVLTDQPAPGGAP